MQSRLTTIPGATDLVVKFAMMLFKQYVQPGKSDMYNAFSMYLTAKTCGLTSRALGRGLSLWVNQTTPTAYYQQELTWDLKRESFGN